MSNRRSSISTGRSELSATPRLYVTRVEPHDVSDVGKATFKKVQRRFAHLGVVAVTPQGVEGIEESP